MSDAIAIAPFRALAGIGKQFAQLFFQPVGSLFLHPIIVLPTLVYLLGGTASQIAWYAVIAGVATGVAAPIGAVVTAFPEVTRLVAGILLAVQCVGFLIFTFLSLRVGSVSSDTLLTMFALGYLVLVLPTGVLVRVIDQSREYARPVAGSSARMFVGVGGVLLAGLAAWRLGNGSGLGPDDLAGRITLAGALALLCASWFGMLPILTSAHLPYPARALPTQSRPGFFTNAPLMRYCLFQLLERLSRFADPFIAVAVTATYLPTAAWWGGAVLAFAAGEAVGRVFMTSSDREPNPRSAIVVGTFLRALALLTVAFLPAIGRMSLITDRDIGDDWHNWTFIVAALVLGTGYRLTAAGNASYVQSITPPGTRELTRAVVGVVLAVAAFSPIIGIQLLERYDYEILMRYGAAAAVVALLASAMVVRPYSTPARRRGSWSLRVQRP